MVVNLNNVVNIIIVSWVDVGDLERFIFGNWEFI